MTPFVRKVEEYAKDGSVIHILCRYPTSYAEYKKALKEASVDELNTALHILKEFPKINGSSRKRILEKLSILGQLP